MKTIASFSIDHDKLEKGMYISRIDGDAVTYDIRMKKPNMGDYVSNGALHTFEHLFATYARNGEFADHVLYIGPMGCRTGFYMLLAGDYSSAEIAPLVTEMFTFIRDFRGEIPGAAPAECGNYLDQNPGMARWLASRFLENTLYKIDEAHLIYPE